MTPTQRQIEKAREIMSDQIINGLKNSYEKVIFKMTDIEKLINNYALAISEAEAYGREQQREEIEQILLTKFGGVFCGDPCPQSGKMRINASREELLRAIRSKRGEK